MHERLQAEHVALRNEAVQLVENDGAAAGSLADPLAKPAVEGRDEARACRGS